MKSVRLGEKIINKNSLPYIIAEIGVNHECSLNRAFKQIELAKKGGADGVKLQAYKAEKIASVNSPSYWDLNMEPTKNQYQLFKKYDSFSEQDYISCAQHANDLGIDFLCTPFDLDAVDFLDPLVPFHKIASADITNIPLLKKVASKGKPVVISTGASSLCEISHAVSCLYDSGAEDVIPLQCVLNYPTEYKDQHLGMIESLKNVFSETVVGLSDHTIADHDMFVLTASYLLGARVIEKHFTDDKKTPGGDHLHSMDFHDLVKLKDRLEFARTIVGSSIKKPLSSEMPARKYARRSLVINKNLSAGSVLREQDIIAKRPGTGISPIYLNDVIGMRLTSDLLEDHVLKWQDLA